MFRYIPTKLWGFSGHIQTIIQSGMSRLHCPLVNGRRLFKIASDGATVTYDVYEPIERHSSNGESTLRIVILYIAIVFKATFNVSRK